MNVCDHQIVEISVETPTERLQVSFCGSYPLLFRHRIAAPMEFFHKRYQRMYFVRKFQKAATSSQTAPPTVTERVSSSTVLGLQVSGRKQLYGRKLRKDSASSRLQRLPLNRIHGTIK